MGRRVDNVMPAFLISLASTTVNVGLAVIWHHYEMFPAFVISMMGSAFSGVLLMMNVFRLIDASVEDDVEANRKRLERY